MRTNKLHNPRRSNKLQHNADLPWGLAALVLKYKAERNSGLAQNLAIRDTTIQITAQILIVQILATRFVPRIKHRRIKRAKDPLT